MVRKRKESEDVGYLQHEEDWLAEVFWCSNQSALVQIISSIDTREGQVLTWPNILQHQVQPFKLTDLMKPGHRKILALFFTDPNI